MTDVNRKFRAKPVAAGKVISGVLKSWGLRKALLRNSIITKWPQLVSPAMAKHVTALKVQGSVLFLLADSSVWMNEISALKNVLIEKIHSELGFQNLISDIRLHQRSWARQESSAEIPAKVIPEISSKDKLEIAKIVNPIKDGDLKGVLMRILEKDRKLKYMRCQNEQRPSDGE